MAPRAGTALRKPALRRGNRQTLAAFCAAPLENQPPILCAHPHEKTVRAPASAAIRLERTLHNVGPLQRTGITRRNPDSNERSTEVSIAPRFDRHVCHGLDALLQSRPLPWIQTSHLSLGAPTGSWRALLWVQGRWKTPAGNANPEFRRVSPQVFHNCGKKCGKALVFAFLCPPIVLWHRFSLGEG